MVRFALVLSALALPAVASANCDALVKKAATVKGDALVSTYKALVKCDKAAAETAYLDFLKETGDVPTMVALSLTAIDSQVFMPVWTSLEKVKDYTARDETSRAIGAACEQHPQVVVFLKGAYLGLKNIQFSQWDDAFAACPSAELEGWLQARVEDPPANSFDEKYNTVLQIWTDRKGPEAMPSLAKAATDAAAKGGPFNSVLEAMDRSIQPTSYGADVTPEHKALLTSTLVAIAGALSPERARFVADRLFNAGAETEAASLLPRVYPDRVQAGGAMMYGVASVEACDNQVILHVAPATEPATRWSVGAELEAPARAFKARLKCKAEEPWPVLVTPEPVADSKGIDAWVATLTKQWTDKGMTVKTRAEPAIALPPKR
jgi:hypothetical protein